MRTENLEENILREFYGDVAGDIYVYLKNKAYYESLPNIVRGTGYPRKKVQETLVGLIQHGMMDFYHHPTRYCICYKLIQERIRHLFHFPRMVQCVGELYGAIAEMIVEELLCEGRLLVNSLVSVVTERINAALVEKEKKEIHSSQVLKKFEQLVAVHFIKRCSRPVKDGNGRVVGLEPPPLDQMFVIPPASSATSDYGVTEKTEPDTEEERPRKRRRIESTTSELDQSDDGPVYWEINIPRFLRHFRDQLFVSAVINQMDNKKAGEVMRTMLRHCEKTTVADAVTTEPMTFHEIFSQLPSDLGMTRDILRQWLNEFTARMPNFVSKVGDSGDGMYVINTFKAIENLCAAHLESVVGERCGSKAFRIFRMLNRFLRRVEQPTIESKVLMAVRYCRELLYDMVKDGFIHKIELSKSADYSPSHTFYLFHVVVGHVVRSVLNHSYKTLNNLVLMRSNIVCESQWLLEKKDRVEVLLGSLGLPLGLAHGDLTLDSLQLDEEKKEQAEVIVGSITPSEQNDLRNIKITCDYVDRCQLELCNNTILVLEAYLKMTYMPGAPKKLFGDISI